MTISNRYDFAFVFDVKDGNPNGDPDAGNLPRIDPETNQGLVSDVCIKRKVRNYVLATKGGKEPFDIFVKEKGVLNELIDAAVESVEQKRTESDQAGDADKRKGKTAKRSSSSERADGEVTDKARVVMCEKYFDVRTFGAVMSTGKNAGQVRGPVQITFSRSIDPIFSQEHSITRMAVATSKEAEDQKGDNRTMGRKNTVPYGIYMGFGFVSPQFASQTKFSQADLDVVWESFGKMFELDRSAARGLMSLQKLVVFRHESALGNAPAHRLFDAIDLRRRADVAVARKFSDYTFGVGPLPKGVTKLELNDSGALAA
jgi:CRISPR-associated protein Csd2